jgi:hypothetical protein
MGHISSSVFMAGHLPPSQIGGNLDIAITSMETAMVLSRNIADTD